MILLLRIFIFLIFTTAFCQETKINGVSLVSPPSPTSQKQLATVKQVNANWIAVIPYAFMKGYTTNIIFNTNFQWWGERLEGTEALIKQAKDENLKILLKPHLWVSGDGWAGDFSLKNEIDWLQWEASYTKYILAYAEIAQANNIELFCIGTELRQVAKQRPQFWKALIQKIKISYKGKLTYAANWDNYQNIHFWKDLDYIGIDSYFPLSQEKTPTIDRLKKAWKPIKTQLKNYSNYHQKPVLFTEFGYTSSNYNAKESWSDNSNHKENQKAQANTYNALFSTLWNEDWFAGGFLWKWHLQDKTKRAYRTNFTPQGKEASNIIRDWYKP